MGLMVDEDYKAVEQSFGRFSLKKEFYDRFYDIFLAKDPRIAEKFANTDFDKQKEALKMGLTHLVMFLKGMSDRFLMIVAYFTMIFIRISLKIIILCLLTSSHCEQSSTKHCRCGRHDSSLVLPEMRDYE